MLPTFHQFSCSLTYPRQCSSCSLKDWKLRSSLHVCTSCPRQGFFYRHPMQRACSPCFNSLVIIASSRATIMKHGECSINAISTWLRQDACSDWEHQFAATAFYLFWYSCTIWLIRARSCYSQKIYRFDYCESCSPLVFAAFLFQLVWSFHSTWHIESIVWMPRRREWGPGATISFPVFTYGSRVTTGEPHSSNFGVDWISARNVGFLHYWTFSNLPLFLLALPMLVVMVWSSMWAWKEPLYFQQTTDVSESFIDAKTATRPPYIAFHYARPFATVQFVLSVLAFTNFHVQIVTRLSSGYPIWYWWLASGLLRSKSTVQAGKSPNYFVLVARWIVMYATIQAGLFASFLPPA